MTELNFITYLEAFKPILLIGLENHREFQVCSAAVGVVGDLCRSLTVNMIPHVDEIMVRLMNNLAVCGLSVVCSIIINPLPSGPCPRSFRQASDSCLFQRRGDGCWITVQGVC